MADAYRRYGRPRVGMLGALAALWIFVWVVVGLIGAALGGAVGVAIIWAMLKLGGLL